MYVRVRDLKVGEISDPFTTTDEIGTLFSGSSRSDDEIPAHRAAGGNDYQFIYNATMMYERQSSYQKWIEEKLKTTYIKISEEFRSCKFLETWMASVTFFCNLHFTPGIYEYILCFIDSFICPNSYSQDNRTSQQGEEDRSDPFQ